MSMQRYTESSAAPGAAWLALRRWVSRILCVLGAASTGVCLRQSQRPVKGNAYTEKRSALDERPITSCRWSTACIISAPTPCSKATTFRPEIIALKRPDRLCRPSGPDRSLVCRWPVRVFEDGDAAAWETLRSWTIVEDFTVLFLASSERDAADALGSPARRSRRRKLKGLTDGFTTNVGGWRLLAWGPPLCGRAVWRAARKKRARRSRRW